MVSGIATREWRRDLRLDRYGGCFAPVTRAVAGNASSVRMLGTVTKVIVLHSFLVCYCWEWIVSLTGLQSFTWKGSKACEICKWSILSQIGLKIVPNIRDSVVFP